MLFRFMAVASFFCGVIGSVGGMQWGYLGIFRGFLQCIFFLVLTVVFHIWAEAWDHYTARKKRKKRTIRSTSSDSSSTLSL